MRSLKSLLLVLILAAPAGVHAQQLLTDMIDTTTEIGKGMLTIYQRFGSIKFSGYTQPQFQWVEEKGGKTFEGGDFAPHSNNRFMLRRNRIRMDYLYTNKKDQLAAYFVFQFDATERGVFARDMFGRFLDNRWELFYVTAGLFARPFGYEVNLPSFDRESPERGRMSQILMKTERDLGVMVTLEPRRKHSPLRIFKLDLGVFNGPGLSGTTDFDSYKDIIGRVALKPYKLTKHGLSIGAGASVLYGSVGSQYSQIYETKRSGGIYMTDSSAIDIDAAAPRHYYGADLQLKLPNRKGATELRAEFITGKQTATASTSETPGVYPVSSTGATLPLYTRSFNGAYFYFLQHLFSDKHQLVVKYDWYDPNTKVSGKQITKANGFSAADIKFSTLGLGYVYYINPHLKATFYYDMVTNESTGITGYTEDAKDNVFTCRLQFRF